MWMGKTKPVLIGINDISKQKEERKKTVQQTNSIRFGQRFRSVEIYFCFSVHWFDTKSAFLPWSIHIWFIFGRIFSLDFVENKLFLVEQVMCNLIYKMDLSSESFDIYTFHRRFLLHTLAWEDARTKRKSNDIK